MEIDIQCACGKTYGFDVEPVNNEMPGTVACPACGRDGTADANAILAKANTSPSANTSTNASVSASTDGSAGPHGSVPSPTPLFSAPKGSPPMPSYPGARSVLFKGADSDSDQNLPMGIAGALGAGLAGMIAWFLLIKFTGYEIGYAAWGVGVLTGFGGRKLARQPSRTLGLVAGACAFIAIIGGQYLATKSQFDMIVEEALKDAYQARLEFAKEAVKAQTDDELKAAIAKQDQDENGKAGPAPSDADLAKFKQVQLPQLKKLADGTQDKAAFESEMRAQMNSPLAKSLVLKSSVGFFTLLWLFFGVGSAFKICARET